jgi:hypothetical protein
VAIDTVAGVVDVLNAEAEFEARVPLEIIQ